MKDPNLYLTDSPTTDDRLGFSAYCAALLDIARNAETPIAIGIFGSWGSGKTSLLQMVRKDIESSQLPTMRTVWFNAWKYDHHDAIWRALILRVLDALYPREGDGPESPESRPIIQNPTEEQAEQISLLQHLQDSVYRAIDWEEFSKGAPDWIKLIKEAGGSAAELIDVFMPIPGLAESVSHFLLGKSSDSQERKGIIDFLRGKIRSHHLEKLAHVEQFEQVFQQVLKLALPADGRLIVFVDDLDRCMPEQALEVLEAVKLFLEVPGSVFVLAMDEDVIRQGIESYYHKTRPFDPSELAPHGDVYLQKFIQISFHIPPLSAGSVEVFIDSFQSRYFLDPTGKQVFVLGLAPNPRQIKRAINTFRLINEIAGVRRAEISSTLLAKTVIIQTQYPELYREWSLRPALLQTLEQQLISPPDREGTDLPLSTLLAPYLTHSSRYLRLQEMLKYGPTDVGQAAEGPVYFRELTRDEIARYVHLVGAAGGMVSDTESLPNLLEDILSGDKARIDEAMSRLNTLEPRIQSKLREDLRAIMVERLRASESTPKDRATAGKSLARLGDPRFDKGRWWLPNDDYLGFVEIPAGDFLMGSDPALDRNAQLAELPQHSLYLPGFFISLYPVTVAQFKYFVQETKHKLSDERGLANPDNHPIVLVNWFDALAYCDWLSEQLRTSPRTPTHLTDLLHLPEPDAWRVSLPSEAQWEKAARGSSKCIYPWGNDFIADNANCWPAEIGATSSVGCFPHGRSDFGVEDLSGNVWEWTRSLWGPSLRTPEFVYPYRQDNREALDAPNDAHRIVRGGSFRGNAYDIRICIRSAERPDNKHRDFGFRLALLPPAQA